MKTKLHLIIMSLVLLFVAGGQSVCLAAESWSYPSSKPVTPFGGGKGSKSNPYIISTAQHLANLSWMISNGEDYKGDYFVMTNDIVMNDNVIDANGEYNKYKWASFTPWFSAGKYNSGFDDEFMGHFDGKGHCISGMYIVYIEGNNGFYGLFGRAEDATIKNLTIKDSYMNVSSWTPETGDYFRKSAGFIVGYLESGTTKININNCHVVNSVIENNSPNCYIGGVAGALKLCMISNCSFSGKIYNNAMNVYCGGIAGVVLRATFDYSSDNNKIYNCATDGTITAMNGFIGGMFGWISCAKVNNSVSKMNIIVSPQYCDDSGYYLYIGGFAGKSFREIKYEECAQIGNIEAKDEFNLKYNLSSNYLQVAISGFTNSSGDASIAAKDNQYFYDCVSIGDIDLSLHMRRKTFSAFSGFVTHTDFKYTFYAFDLFAKRCISYHKVRYLNDYPYPHCFYPMFGYPRAEYKYVDEAEDLYCGIDVLEGPVRYWEGDNVGEKISLDAIKAKIPALNAAAKSDKWAMFTETDDESYKGLPMLKMFGGTSGVYEGAGTASSPYIIRTESDLKSLQTSISSGSNIEGKYFRLDADIYGGNISTIGESSDKPFKGHFDGNGHAIIGLRRCLFGYMYGTVKNLTLLEADVSSQSDGAILAMYIGNSEGSVNAEISNCYASGIVNVKRGWSEAITAIGGLCNHIYAGSKVHDCYFKGTLQASNDSFTGNYMAAGIAVFNSNKNGIYNCYASFDVKQSGSFIGGSNVYGISDYGMSNCYAIVSTTRTDSGCTLLNAEAELSASALGDQWIQGLYRPVLKGTKYYEVTTSEGDITYLDGIPAEVAVEDGEVANAARRANARGTDENADALKSNYITCYVPKSEEELHDVILWSLPNVAIYSAEDKMDVIPNFYLDNREDLQYTPTPGATKAMGAMYYPLQPNSTGWHMLCLPGYVTKDLFPESSRLFVVDGVDNAAMTVLVSEVDTISPATPFIAYIPVEAEDVNLVSFGDLVFTPRTASATSPLMGTFSNTTQSDCATELSADGKTILHSLVSDIKPFQAWLPGVTGDMEISATPTGIKLIGRDSDGNERIYNLRGMEMKSEKGIYIKGGKVRIKN